MMDQKNQITPQKTQNRYRFLQVLFITLFFLSLGFFIRRLPNQTCGLLHYEVVTTDSNGIEFCKDEAGVLLDLDLLRFPIRLIADWSEPFLRVRVIKDTGEVFFPYEVARSHKEKIHLFVVNESLTEYHHLHPVGDDSTGDWIIPFEPKSSGTFRVFAQFVHQKTKRTLTTSTQIVVGGNCLAESGTASSDPMVNVRMASGVNITEGEIASLVFEIEHAGLGPLEPLMGAYAHAAIFQHDANRLAHLHPLATTETVLSKSLIKFLFKFSDPHAHILWLQFQLQGRPYFYRFELGGAA